MPIAPRLGDALASEASGAAQIDELVGDQHWNGLRITGDLSGERFDLIEISDCRLVGTGLSRLDLDGVRIRDTVFDGCDLSGVLMQDASLTRVTFENCRLSGLMLNSSKLRDVRVTDCKADQLSLRMATVERLWCERVLLTAADMYAAELHLTRLFDCDLTDAELSEARLDDVWLHGSRLEALRGVASLRGATIDPEQALDVAAALLDAHRIVVSDREDDTTPSSPG